MYRKKRERGAAVVELAVVLPVLLIIIFSVVDFGRFIYTKIALSSASFEIADAIARGLFMASDNDQTKSTKMRAVLTDIAPGIASFAQLDSEGSLSLLPLPAGCPNGAGKTVVTLTTAFKPISPLNEFFDSASSNTAMRCLR